MKFITKTSIGVVGVVLAMLGLIAAPTASAYPTTGNLGSALRMVDSVGQVELTWAVSDLRASSDTVPGYPVAGRLWEATATVNAVRGTVTPAISQFNARTNDGANYRVLWQVASPNSISGATLPQGEQASGKIYFDVTGPSPTIVAMNNGMEDLLVWTS